MSTKQKNRHGRVGVKRSTHVSPSDARRKQQREGLTPRVVTKQEQTDRVRNLMSAWAGRIGTRSWGRNPGAGTLRAQEREKAEAARRDAMYGKASKKKVKKHEGPIAYSVDPKTADLLRSSTVAQLKKICDDNGIEYKSKDTKAVLLGKLGVQS